MYRKLFGIGVLVLSLFAGLQVHAAQGDFTPQTGLREHGLLGGFQPYPTDANATVSPTGLNDVQFNMYKDNYHLAYLRGQIPEAVYQCVFGVLSLQKQGIDATAYTKNCRESLATYVQRTSNNAEKHLDERDFLVAAVNPEGNALTHNRYELDETIPTYDHTILDTLQENDKVRVFAYVHNNSSETNGQIARNTRIKFSWPTNNAITTEISASNASGNSSINGSIFDTVDFALPQGLSLRPTRLHVAKYFDLQTIVSEAIDIPIQQREFEYNIGDHNPCFGGVLGYYIDFEIIRSVPAEIVLNKTVEFPGVSADVASGDIITYRLQVGNAEQIPAVNIAIRDALNENVAYVPGSAVVTPAASRVEVVNGELQIDFDETAGSTSIINATFQVEVLDSAPVGQNLCNSFITRVSEPRLQADPFVYTSNEVCNPVILDNDPLLNLIKTANPASGSTVDNLDEISYVLTVENNHTENINNVVITDLLPSQVEFVRDGGGSGTFAIANDRVTINIGTLTPGQTQSHTMVVRVRSTTPATDIIVNTGVVTGQDQSGNTLTDASSTVHFMPLASRAFTIIKTANPRSGTDVLAGQRIEYFVTVINGDTVRLDNINTTDVLENELVFGALLGGDGTSSLTGTTITTDFESLEVGQAKTMAFTTNVVAEANLDNELVINQAIGTAERESVAITATSNQTLHPVRRSGNGDDPVLEVTKTATPASGSVVNAEENITYTIQVQNNGLEVLTNVIVTDALNENLTFVSVLGGDGLMAVENGVATIEFGDLAAGETKSQVFVVEINAGTPDDVVLVNTALAEGETPTGNILIDTDSTVHFMPNADQAFFISKRALPPRGTTVFPLQEVRYFVTVGGFISPLVNVNATDVLDTDATYVGAVDRDAIVTEAGNTISLAFAPLLTGQIRTQDFLVRVNPADALDAGNELRNTATATAKDLAGNDLSDTSNEVIHPINPDGPTPDLEINKTANPVSGTTVRKDFIIAYTLTARNNTATSTFENIVITDALDAGVDIDLTTLPADVLYDAVGHTVTINIAELAPGATESFTFEVIVLQEFNYTIRNIAEITGTDQDTGDTVTDTSDEVQHPLPTRDTGSGGATRSVYGSCAIVGRTGAPECRRYQPHVTQGAPYFAYLLCQNDATVPDKDICIDNWAEDLGIDGYTCNDDSECLNIEEPVTCGPLTMPTFGQGEDAETFDIGAVDAKITKSILKRGGNKISKIKASTVPRGETVQYEIRLDMEMLPELGEKVRRVDIRFYDYTIPATSSGWVWNREGVEAEGWERYKGGQYYKKIFERDSNLVQSLAAGKSVAVQMRYNVDTALAMQADEGVVDNMAFAVVEYSYMDGQTQYIVIGQDAYGNLCEITDLEKAKNGYYFTVVAPDGKGGGVLKFGDIATLGSTATIDIKRPFIEVKGGSDAAVKIKDNEEKLFADMTTKAVSGQLIENPDAQQGELGTESVLDEVKANATFKADTNYFGQQWYETSDKNGMYFYDGDVSSQIPREQRQMIIDLKEGMAFPASKTFVIENTDVVIRSNVELLGDFAAFIIRGGDLIIEDQVEVIEGFYIVQEGQIIAENTSDRQLFVSGSLVGNARDLFLNRRYIGDFDRTGVLEPSIKVNFDLRLLDGTPPGIQGVLGEHWGQKGL